MPGPTYDEWLRYAQANEARKDAAHDRAYQRQAVVAIAKKAETVVNHEGWQTFLDHLSALRDQAVARQDTLTRRLNGDVWGDALAETKAALRGVTGEIRAYDAAMNLIPSLIAAGAPTLPDSPTGDSLKSSA